MEDFRDKIVKFCQLLYSRRLNCGYAGNVSCRDGDRIFITPAGIPKHRLKKEQVLETDLEGNPLSPGKPSTEARMHYAIYARRPEIRAIIHAHPPFLSIVAVAALEFKPVLPEMEIVLGEIALIPYIRPGTEELAQAVREKLSTARLGVLFNHGAVAVGESLEEALDFLEMGESFAHTLVFVHLLGRFNILTPEEVDFFRGKATH
ncbi:MAG: class II aldolase/adducin family protein [Coprothermobacterota bacterium]|nr:class II aldolase/adducin family protein [Coprothermobacterota bacterium]